MVRYASMQACGMVGDHLIGCVFGDSIQADAGRAIGRIGARRSTQRLAASGEDRCSVRRETLQQRQGVVRSG